MIYSWLHRHKKAQNLIVFFNGWGMGQDFIKHLNCDANTDVMVATDYQDLSIDIPNIDAYQHRSVIAWSFGVANYSVWQQHRPDYFDTKVAINGTIQGVDRLLGIPERVVQHTIDTLSHESYKEFLSRCLNLTEHKVGDIEESELALKKQELNSIKDRNYSVNGEIKWDNVWISQNDRIFPFKNQMRAWQNHSFSIINAAHAPFSLWHTWHEILSKPR
ncbi:MAG: DUF452 family protein [Acidiferrobacterales bacterium]|nr:DUF452 family protein [Acidiferrobacterales bacterium]